MKARLSQYLNVRTDAIYEYKQRAEGISVLVQRGVWGITKHLVQPEDLPEAKPPARKRKAPAKRKPPKKKAGK